MVGGRWMTIVYLLVAWRSLAIDVFAGRNSTVLRKAPADLRMTIARRSLAIDLFSDRNSTFSAESAGGPVDDDWRRLAQLGN